jgi:hypothetical protein
VDEKEKAPEGMETRAREEKEQLRLYRGVSLPAAALPGSSW